MILLYHLISGNKHELLWANIGSSKMWESEKEKLLGIVIDRNLHFDEYILSQCKKAGRKLSVLVRICKFMTIEHGRKPLLNLNLVIVLFYSVL